MRNLILLGIGLLAITIAGVACAEATPTPTPTPVRAVATPTPTATPTPAPTPTPVPVTLRYAGLFTTSPGYQDVQRPYVGETLRQQSKGRLVGVPFPGDELGLTGFEYVRILTVGAIDMASFVTSYVAGDVPLTDGLEIPALFPDLATTHKATDAYLPALSNALGDKFKLKILSIWANPPNVIWCKGTLKSIDDLKGKRVRTFGTGLPLVMGRLGATGVTVAFAEVYSALERKVVDCAITAAGIGNRSKWFEVTDTLFNIGVAIPVQIEVIRQETWNSLAPQDQQVLQSVFTSLAEAGWKHSEKLLTDGVNCTVGRDPCEIGIKAKLALLEPTPEDKAKLRKAAEETAAPSWTSRCGAQCTATWNQTIGKVLGIELR